MDVFVVLSTFIILYSESNCHLDWIVNQFKIWFEFRLSWKRLPHVYYTNFLKRSNKNTLSCCWLHRFFNSSEGWITHMHHHTLMSRTRIIRGLNFCRIIVNFKTCKSFMVLKIIMLRSLGGQWSLGVVINFVGWFEQYKPIQKQKHKTCHLYQMTEKVF